MQLHPSHMDKREITMIKLYEFSYEIIKFY